MQQSGLDWAVKSSLLKGRGSEASSEREWRPLTGVGTFSTPWPDRNDAVALHHAEMSGVP